MERSTFAIMACLMGIFAVFADNDPQDFKVVAYRADGTHFEGYVTTALRRYFRPKVSEVGISEIYGGESREYSSDEVKTIVYPPNKKDSTSIVYEAVTAMVQKNCSLK